MRNAFFQAGRINEETQRKWMFLPILCVSSGKQTELVSSFLSAYFQALELRQVVFVLE